MIYILAPLIVGIAFGVIDIIPMKIKKIDRYSIFSAFSYHMIMPFVLLYNSINIPYILSGGIVYLICGIPIYILVMKEDRKSVLIMAVTSAVLGTVCGVLFQLIFK